MVFQQANKPLHKSRPDKKAGNQTDEQEKNYTRDRSDGRRQQLL